MKRYLLFFLCFLFIAEGRLPQITGSDAKAKIEEILRYHACYKTLTSELMARAFQNFLEEMDPAKTYLLASEVEPWVHPSEELLRGALLDFKTAGFAEFRKMHALFLKAIERRSFLEEEIAARVLPSDVRSEEFKEISWAETSEALASRILRIRALQLHCADKFAEEGRDKFLQRLEKRRLHREAELVSVGDRANVVFVYAMKAIAAALDAHTNYFTQNEANQFMIQVQQRLFGIGAQLRDDLDGLSVVRVIENSPASQNMRLRIHDKILAVNQEPIVGMEITEAVEMIRGEQGTSVSLTVLRDGEVLTVDLVRGEIVLEESRLEVLKEPFGEGCIATLRLFSFYQDPSYSSAQDMRKALEQIRLENRLSGVILDLRGNAGGLLTQAVSVTGLFISKGIVVSIKDHAGRLQHLRETGGHPVWEGPLIVLVNRASASAAEIVAQTLQDYGRAIVVGDARTFGKGSFQTFTLDPTRQPKVNPQGEYKVTRGRYYTVSGKSPQLQGVRSDIIVPGILSKVDIGEEFAKFPLANDSIEPNFEDDLSDLSAFQRLALGAGYRNQLQPRLASYAPFLERLQKNSETRILRNKQYQKFLADMDEQNFDSVQIDLFSQADFQYLETLNILKDLLFLQKGEDPGLKAWNRIGLADTL